MKKVTLTIVTVMLGALIASGAQATVPELIPVQGVLTDGVGDFIDGSTNMVFRLYDSETAATPIYTETLTGGDAPDVDEGFFTVYLGAVTAIDPATLAAASELWLGVTVGTDSEMNRTQLGAVPFALEAQRCEQVGSLTEGDINSNFLPSTYTPAWGDLTGVPAGFADNTDDGFTTEGDLTALLNDNYAPISHTHAWSDLTGVPAGLSDGDDVGFTTEGQLTALLNDNYAAASHVHAAGSGRATLPSTAIANFLELFTSSSNYTPPRDQTCLISCDARVWMSSGTITTGYTLITTEISTDGSNSFLTTGFNEMGVSSSPGTNNRAGASISSVVDVNAGTPYWFGCGTNGTGGGYVGKTMYSYVTYLCVDR